MAERPLTDAELDAAIAALSEPQRLRAAQDMVMRAAPSLQRVFAAALNEGGWFDAAHEQAMREATGDEDPHVRARATRTLLAEETRLGMLVGVAVGFELARELGHGTPESHAIPAAHEAQGNTHAIPTNSREAGTGSHDAPTQAQEE
jgi:hypothetical protein